MSEGVPLLATTTRNETQKQWTLFHTVWSIVIRIIGDILTKTVLVFYENYRHALNLSMQQFSGIIISHQIGALVAMFSLPFINKRIPNLRDKISIFGFLCGILSIGFIVSPIISSNEYFILICSCVNRVLFGVSFYVYITSILDLASQANDENSGKQGKIIALLNLSWTIASLFYIVVGYTIEYINWWFSFVLFGIMLCIFSIISHFVFNRIQPQQPTPKTSWIDSMRSVLCSTISTLIFCGSLLMGTFTTSFVIIVSSIWLEDVFHLNSFQVGMVAFATFGGELFALLSISELIDKYDIFKCSVIGFGTILLASLTVFILSYLFGATVGGLVIAMIIIFILYFGWESFFITHQLLCIRNAPKKDETSLMLMMNFVCLCIGNMIGSYLSTILWNQGKGMCTINLIWIACVTSTCLLYFIIYFIRQNARVVETENWERRESTETSNSLSFSSDTEDGTTTSKKKRVGNNFFFQNLTSENYLNSN